MLKLPTLGEMDRAASVRIFLCTLPTDMHKSFNSLVGLAEQQLGDELRHSSI